MIATNIIRLASLKKVYGKGEAGVIAVNGINLNLEKGKLTLLMGPSGSGKTTLLMLIGCLLKPSSGTVTVDGFEVSALSERELPRVRRKYIGFIFQSFNLFPALTALENVKITLNLKNISGAKAHSAASEALEKVGLKDRMCHLPADLSGGEKQRVAIARALAGNPPVILADEPTGMLDSRTGRMIVTILRDLAKTENRLVFMVSHDNRILDLADQILWMEDGNLRASSQQKERDHEKNSLRHSAPLFDSRNSLRF